MRPLLTSSMHFSPSLSSVCFALLPKCPMCLASLATPLGITLPGSSWVFDVAALLFLAGPVGLVIILACRRAPRYLLVVLGLGPILMVTGRFLLSNSWFIEFGACLTIGVCFLVTKSRRCYLLQCSSGSKCSKFEVSTMENVTNG